MAEQNIQAEIKNLLRKAVEKSNWQVAGEINLDIPKHKEFGDFTTNLPLILARQIGEPSLELARRIAQALEKELARSKLAKVIARIEVEGRGFINFFFTRDYLYAILREINKQKQNFGRSFLGKGKRIHIEFVSANPTGPLNVAHARQAAFGDTLANLLAFCGFKVHREYYLNDEGVQIELLGESVRAKYLQLLGRAKEFPASGYRGRYIDDLARMLVQKYKDKFCRTEKEGFSFFSNFAYQQILKAIKADLHSFGVNFDCWLSQKRLKDTGKIEKAIQLLRRRGFIYAKDGAWWLASSRFGDDKDRVVIKSDARLTYIAPDIAYHQLKFKQGFFQIINIWGPDHHGYIPRIKAAVSALGYDPGRLKILIVQLVSLVSADKLIPISTRQGQYISLQEVLQAVGKDAARFFFLMRKRDAHLHFDLELARKQSLENPVYYIQYAHARICNILRFARRRLKGRSVPFKKEVDLSLLEKEEELNLMQRLNKFPRVIESCALNLEPHRITTYLQDLAKDFHHYYEKYRVITDDVRLSRARLFLVQATRIVLNNGLRLLSIYAPEKM